MGKSSLEDRAVWNSDEPHNRVIRGTMRVVSSEDDLTLTVLIPKYYGSKLMHIPLDLLPEKIYEQLQSDALFDVRGTLKTHYLRDLRFTQIDYVKEETDSKN